MSARAAFAAALAAVLLLAVVPWSGGPLRRLAGGGGEGRDPAFDVQLDVAALRAAECPPRYFVDAATESPLAQGNAKAAGQLYFACGFPVLDRADADTVLRLRDGRITVGS